MDKQARIQIAKEEATARRKKTIASVAHCLSRSDVMRFHHNLLVQELVDTGAEFSDAKKVRFAAYTCFWFAGLAAVIERFQKLTSNGTLPKSEQLSNMITDDFIDLLKPFRNAVAHCSDHDDRRVLNMLSRPDSVPDLAEQISDAFKKYFEEHGFQYA